MLNDLRYAFRSLLKTRGFTLVAIVTLALGIGATTAIYSVVHAVVLQPLPYPQPGQVVTVSCTDRNGGADNNVAPPDYLDWQRECSSFSSLAAIENASVNLTGQGEPRRLRAAKVTPEFWQVFGLSALRGRTFTAEELARGGDQVAVISYNLWQREFGGEPGLLGRNVQLNGRAITIIGIMPPRFQADARYGLWMPLVFTAKEKSEDYRGYQYLRVVGRLKSGATLTAAQAEISLVARRIEQAFPGTNTDVGAHLRPLLDSIVGDLRPVLYTLLAAVGALLLIACVNVANLLLARATARLREISVRSALGASPARIIRQLLTESVVLAAAGGALGVLIASWGVDALVALFPADVPRAGAIGLNGPVLTVALVVTLGCGLAFGLAPALQSARLSLVETLKDGGRGHVGNRHHRLRHALVIAEVALALALLVSASLLMQSFLRLLATSPGFRTTETYNFGVALPPAQYDSPEKQAAFVNRVIERIGALPGVKSVGTVQAMPLAGTSWNMSVLPSSQPDLPDSQWPIAGYYRVSPDYFGAIGIPLLRGRAFTPADRTGAPPVAIISRSFADKFFAGQNPIGQRIKIPREGPLFWSEIVGVVGDVKQRTLEADSLPQIYEPVAQQPYASMGVVVHAPQARADFADSLRATMRAIDPNLPLIGLGSIHDLVGRSIATRRFFTLLLGIFTGIALLLAAIGIYGVMAYNVSQRTREYGVRMALGATTGGIRALVLRRAGVLVVLGSGLGLAGALAASRLLSSMLFKVSPFAPVPYLAAIALFAAVALLASWLPARRATRVDPMVALRAE